MLEKLKRKKVDRQEDNRPESIEQLIEKYGLEYTWEYIDKIIDELNKIEVYDLERFQEFIDRYKEAIDVNGKNIAVGGQGYDSTIGGTMQIKDSLVIGGTKVIWNE